MMKKLRILVFDDNKDNCAAARAQLKEHDLTVVSTYDQARELITPRLDYKKVYDILDAEFGKDFRLSDVDNETRARYFAVEKAATEKVTIYPDFDVVLSDLLVPASGKAQGSDEFIGQEMSVGVFIGLLAAVRGRAKWAAVFTDSGHHDHPASACIDPFNTDEGRPLIFTVEGCKVLLSNARNWVNQFDPNDLTTALEYEQYSVRSDTVRAKNWAVLLAYLVENQ